MARHLVLVLVGLVTTSFTPNQKLCQGFLPENGLRIPVSAFQNGGITQAEFESVLDQVEAHYAPIISSQGGRLVVNRDWNSAVVNASANRLGNQYMINMYGGLARHPAITKDGFMLVACHEIGHHLAGAPKLRGWMGSWASNEGASDYFATLRCLRALFNDGETAKFLETVSVDPALRRTCEETYQTQAEENVCMRAGLAGFSGASLFQALREETDPPRFDRPDPRIVTRMDDDHPATQCRLDTYYQGGLCVHDVNQPLSDTDYHQGTCTERNGQRIGLRPRCWFRP